MANPIDFISVVIPLYNKENQIQRAINSVLAQTHPHFELIIVEDGSTDRSFVNASKFVDDRLRIVRQANGGVSIARNRGVAESHSDWVAFLDADDEWHPKFLESIIELRTQFSDANIFGSSYYIQYKHDALRLPRSSSLFSQNWKGIIPNFLETLHAEYPFHSSSFAVMKQALEGVGGFPIGVQNGEDVDTWIRLSIKSTIAYINKPLSIYHGDAENRLCYPNAKPPEIFYPVNKLNYYLSSGEISGLQRQSAIEYIAKINLPLAQTYLYLGNTEKAIEVILSCRGTKKHVIKMYWLLFCANIPPKILNSLIKIKHNTINPLFQKRQKN